jgi:hypothetical protein
MHRRPPGARAFSRLPNDKKGKALGTRLFNVLSTENTIKDKITKIFHFITENALLANTFPYYTCCNLLASNMAAVNFRCEAAASKTSKE